MKRYFLEVAYKGTNYSGFQVQANAITIQSEVEKAMEVFFRKKINLTGSSRTDAGVHARQNYFHFDYDEDINGTSVYNLNAILPDDIVIRTMREMFLKENGEQPHSRFDAVSREYSYYIYQQKDPFIRDRAYYFPYTLDIEKMKESAAAVLEFRDFTSFSKRNTQVKTFRCDIGTSTWREEDGLLVYTVKANRFLRGMVRAMVGTMLQVGRGKISIDEFRSIIHARDCRLADFSAPAHGLFLMRIDYPKNFFG